MLLKRVKMDYILVRVFLSLAILARASLFIDCPITMLFFPLITIKSKGKDTNSMFFILFATFT